MSKRRWLIAACVLIPIVGVGPFIIVGGKGEHRTTAFASMGWPGVIGIWLFMAVALGLTLWDQLRRERIAKQAGMLIDDDSHILDTL